jgi:hypothetical protein
MLVPPPKLAWAISPPLGSVGGRSPPLLSPLIEVGRTANAVSPPGTPAWGGYLAFRFCAVDLLLAMPSATVHRPDGLPTGGDADASLPSSGRLRADRTAIGGRTRSHPAGRARQCRFAPF